MYGRARVAPEKSNPSPAPWRVRDACRALQSQFKRTSHFVGLTSPSLHPSLCIHGRVVTDVWPWLSPILPWRLLRHVCDAPSLMTSAVHVSTQGDQSQGCLEPIDDPHTLPWRTSAQVQHVQVFKAGLPA